MKQFLLIMTILSIGFTSCSSDEINLPNETTISNVDTNVSMSLKQKAIVCYLSRNEKSTRSQSFELIPYIVEGDTLMYIVNHKEGWELFSNSFNMPMVLMKSETGSFSDINFSKNLAFSDFFSNLINTLKIDKNTSEEIPQQESDEWSQFSSQAVNPPSPSIPTPVYTLVGSKTLPTERINVNHLISLEWNQDFPYNEYMPFQKYYTEKHILTGCIPVALGQFFHYSHYKWGIPTTSPSNASYSSSSNEYNFFDFSPNKWDDMTYTYSYINYNTYASKLICWIAKNVNVNPIYKEQVNTETQALPSAMLNYFNNQLNFNGTYSSFNMTRIVSMLNHGQPVIANLNITINGKPHDSGHTVIIDDVDYTSTMTEYYYAYVTSSSDITPNPNPNPNPGPMPGSDDYDELVAYYGQIFTEYSIDTTCFFRLNWGYGGLFNDVEVNGKIFNFTLDNKSYTFNNFIDYTPN